MRHAILIALILVGAGCVAPRDVVSDLPTEPPRAVPAAVPAPQPGTGVSAIVENAVVPSASAEPYYIAYSDAQYAVAKSEGRPVLLYFWASWCPICKAEEPKIRRTVAGSGLPVAGFRVDFDAEKELKKQFRVPYQHTTVILNVRGEETARFTGPVADAELLAALAAAAK